MTALLSFKDVDVHYGNFHALKSVTVDIDAGQRVGLFGHNGCGKSTLLKACVGVHRKIGGRVSLGDKTVEPGNVPLNSQMGIAYVPQSKNVFEELSVERNLLIAGLKLNNSDLEQAWTIFPFLKQRRNQLANTMSGGERQMLAFAMALMTNPRLLLLDEPTTGLSPAMANLVLDTVNRVTKEKNIALVIVEHNVPRTLKVVDRALIMKTGRILSDRSAAELAGQDNFWEWF